MGTAREDAIPHIHYDTRGWKVSDAVEFGREVLRPTYDFGLRNDQSFHWYCTDIWLAGPLLFARNMGDGHLLLREARHLATNPGHYLKLQIFNEAGGMLFCPDEAYQLEPRSVHLIDQSQPYRQKQPSGDNCTVFLPHALLGFKPGTAAYIRFDAASPEGGFLAHSTQAFFDQLPRMTVGEAACMAGAYAGLVRSLVDWRQSRLGGESIREVRFDVARRHIEAHLHDPNFRPDDVLRAVGASRATIFRDFAPFGGLARFLRERRLDRAYRALSMSNPQRGVVGIVAESLGFQSTAELSRAFQHRYGVAPTDVVGQWCNTVTEEPSARPQGRKGLLLALRAVYNLSDPTGVQA